MVIVVVVVVVVAVVVVVVFFANLFVIHKSLSQDLNMPEPHVFPIAITKIPGIKSIVNKKTTTKQKNPKKPEEKKK